MAVEKAPGRPAAHAMAMMTARLRQNYCSVIFGRANRALAIARNVGRRLEQKVPHRFWSVLRDLVEPAGPGRRAGGEHRFAGRSPPLAHAARSAYGSFLAQSARTAFNSHACFGVEVTRF